MPLDYVQELMAEAAWYFIFCIFYFQLWIYTFIYLLLCHMLSYCTLLLNLCSLRMEKEQLFLGISGTLANARSWEDRAQYVLINNCDICDFEDLIRLKLLPCYIF